MESIECIESNYFNRNLIELFVAYKKNNPFVKRLLKSVCIAIIIHCYCWGQLLGFVIALIILCIMVVVQFIKLLITKRKVSKSLVRFCTININQNIMIDNKMQYDLEEVMSCSFFRKNIGLLVNNRLIICKVKSKDDISYIKKRVKKTCIQKRLIQTGIVIFIGIISPLIVFSVANIIYKNKLDNLISEFSSQHTDFSVNYEDNYSDNQYTLKYGCNYIKLYKSLSIIYDEINNLPEGFFDEISSYNSIICLTKYIYDTYDNKYVSGFLSTNYDYNLITVNSYFPFMTKKIFDHELFHYIEYTNLSIIINDNKIYPFKGFDNWNSFNPPNFHYGIAENKYLIDVNEPSDQACFISSYSMTNEEEDRAELFDYLMDLDNRSELYQYLQNNNIKGKIMLMDQVLMDYFDSIDETNCFEWQRWLHSIN